MKDRELLVHADFKNAKLFGAIRTAFFTAPFISCLLVLLTVISAAVPVIEVYAVAWFIDTAIDVINRGISISQVVPAVLVIVILVAYKWLSGVLSELLWKKLSLRLSETFRVSLVQKCAKLNYFYFENKDAQECISRVMGLGEGSIVGIFQTICDAFTLVISVAGIVGIIMTNSILVAVLILIVSIPMMFLARKSGDATYNVSRENTKYERQYGYIGEVLRNRETALERTLFGYTDPLNQKWKSVYDQSSKYIQRAYRSWYAKIELGSVLTALVSLSGVAFLLVPVVQGKMSLGIYISLVNVCFSLISAMSWKLRGIVESLAKQSGFMKDLNRVLSFTEKEGAIGKGGISKDTTHWMVVDWRAPVANVYYENGLGKCSYSAPEGKQIDIDLKLKRTYKIENGRVLDFFDTEVVANDDLLTKYLAKNKQAVLSEIIATIQKEQNDIIRKSPFHNIIVQGVAGSGKTTVAMHRISFILYNYQERFKPDDFYIVGSNRILLNYITGVLPDLDVYGIRQMTMEQLFVRLLYEDWDEKKYQILSSDKMTAKGSVKGTLQWFHDLEAYCRELEWETIPRKTVYLNPKQFVEGIRNGKTGVFDETIGKQINPNDLITLMSREAIERYIEQNPTVSVQSKIKMLNDRLMSKVKDDFLGKGVSYTESELKAIRKAYRGVFGKNVWKQSIFDIAGIYRHL